MMENNMFSVVRSYSPPYKNNSNQSTKQKTLTPCGSQKQTRKANKNPHIIQSKLCSHHQLQLPETYLFTQYETQFTQYATGQPSQLKDNLLDLLQVCCGAWTT